MPRFADGQARLRRLVPHALRYATSSGCLAAASAAQLATFAILARMLGPTQFGFFVQIAALTTLAVQICGLGASDSLLRRVSRLPQSYPTLLGHNVILIGASGTILVVLGTCLMPFWLTIDARPAVNVLTLFVLLLGNVVVVRGILLVETIFLSLDRVGQANRAVMGFALARTATAAVAALCSTRTLPQWAAWQMCGLLLYGLLCLAWLRPLGRPHLTIVREEIRPGLLYCSQFVCRAIRQNVDLFVLGLVAPIALVGSYGVARRITDSSYMSIDAMNRLVYPLFARSTMNGFGGGLHIAGRILGTALAIGCGTALVLFLAGPLLPALFGRGYHDLSPLVRGLSGTIILVAIWSVAIDLLGAAGRQGSRALVLNGASLVGSVLIAAATWLAPVTGTISALYAVEIGTVVAAWLVVIGIARRERGGICRAPTTAVVAPR